MKCKNGPHAALHQFRAIIPRSQMAKTKQIPAKPHKTRDMGVTSDQSRRSERLRQRAANVGLPPFMPDRRRVRGGIVQPLTPEEQRIQADILRRALYMLADYALLRRMRNPQLRDELAFAAYEGIVNCMYEKQMEYLLDWKEQVKNKNE